MGEGRKCRGYNKALIFFLNSWILSIWLGYFKNRGSAWLRAAVCGWAMIVEVYRRSVGEQDDSF